MGIPFVDFLETPIHQDAPTLLTADLARKWLALPVDFEDRKLIVAFAEPADDEAVAAVGTATTYEIIAAVADQDELLGAIDMIYGPSAAPAAQQAGMPDAAQPAVSAGMPRADDLHINDLLAIVIEWRGSDLHLTSGSPPVVRVHGDLRPVPEMPE